MMQYYFLLMHWTKKTPWANIDSIWMTYRGYTALIYMFITLISCLLSAWWLSAISSALANIQYTKKVWWTAYIHYVQVIIIDILADWQQGANAHHYSYHKFPDFWQIILSLLAFLNPTIYSMPEPLFGITSIHQVTQMTILHPKTWGWIVHFTAKYHQLQCI